MKKLLFLLLLLLTSCHNNLHKVSQIVEKNGLYCASYQVWEDRVLIIHSIVDDHECLDSYSAAQKWLEERKEDTKKLVEDAAK